VALTGIPEGAPRVIPRLFCSEPLAEIEFCTAALGGVEGVRRPGADGRIAHAVVLFGAAIVMIESEWPQVTNRAPAPDGATPVAIYLYVADVDQIVERAVAAGPPISSGATGPRGFSIRPATCGRSRRARRRPRKRSGRHGSRD
jgi:PhnB protein